MLKPIDQAVPGKFLRIVVDEAALVAPGEDGVLRYTSRMPETYWSLPDSRTPQFAVIGFLVTPEWDAARIEFERTAIKAEYAKAGFPDYEPKMRKPVERAYVTGDCAIFELAEVVGWDYRCNDPEGQGS